MFYFCLIYDHFAFICYANHVEHLQWNIDGANILGPLILPGSVHPKDSKYFQIPFWLFSLSQIAQSDLEGPQ